MSRRNVGGAESLTIQRKMALKTSIFLVGDESIALGCVRRQLAGEDGYQVEARAFSYSEAVERLKCTSGNTVAVIEIERDPDQAYRLAKEPASRCTFGDDIPAQTIRNSFCGPCVPVRKSIYPNL